MTSRASTGVLLISVLAAGLARAQEGPLIEVQAAALDSKSLGPGTRVKVTGKYKELLDREIVLFDCRSSFLIRRPELLKRLLDMKAQRDNVTLTGTVSQGATTEGPQPASIEVEEINVAASDLDVFSLEIDGIKGSGEAAMKARTAILDRIVLYYERFKEEDLLPFARRVFGVCLREGKEAVGDAEARTYLSLLERLHKAAPDADRSLAMALEILARKPGDEPVEKFLRALNCRRHEGTWMTFEALKRREGFVQLDGKWVTPREKDMQEAIKACQAKKQAGTILRRRTDREYQLLAEKGKVEEGMRPEEVCLALGFAERVERRYWEGREFDQWVYGDKYCYFYGGLLMLKPKEPGADEKDDEKPR